MARKIAGMIRRLCVEDRAATAIEYGLIVSLIVITMIASLKIFAGSTIAMWNDVSTQVEATAP